MIAFPNHFASDKTKGKLIVKFVGLKSNVGEVKVALCNSSNNYEDHKSPFIGQDILIDNKKAIIEFDELPFGEYAVKAFHDEDNNDDLNTNLLGIPSEDYGFSNDARGMFGPPSWDDAKFKFGVEKQTIEIVIK
jgi:uncharacterized protein (DUF2141 family)